MVGGRWQVVDARCEVHVTLKGMLNAEAECKKITKQIAACDKKIGDLNKNLSNDKVRRASQTDRPPDRRNTDRHSDGPTTQSADLSQTAPTVRHPRSLVDVVDGSGAGEGESEVPEAAGGADRRQGGPRGKPRTDAGDAREQMMPVATDPTTNTQPWGLWETPHQATAMGKAA